MVSLSGSLARRSLRLVPFVLLLAVALGCGEEPPPDSTPEPPSEAASEPASAPQPPPTPPPPVETRTVEVSCDCDVGTCTLPELTAFSRAPEQPGQRLLVVWKAVASHAPGDFTIVYTGPPPTKKLVRPASPPPPITFDEASEGKGIVNHERWARAGGPEALDLRWDYKVQFQPDGGESCIEDPQICIPGLNQGGHPGEPCG